MEKHEYILFSIISGITFGLVFFGLSPDATGLPRASNSSFAIIILYGVYLIFAIPQIRRIVIVQIFTRFFGRFEKESIEESVRKAREFMNTNFDSEFLPYADYSRYIQRVIPFYYQGKTPKLLIAFSDMKITNDPENILIVEISRDPNGETQILGKLSDLTGDINSVSIYDYIKNNKEIVLEQIEAERLEKYLAHDERLLKATMESEVAKEILSRVASKERT